MNKIKITLPDGKEIEATVSDEELASMCKKKKRERVKGKEYWYVTHTGISLYVDTFHSFNDECFEMGNYYHTQEEVEFAREKQKAIVRINDRIDELNGDWEREYRESYWTIYSDEYVDGSYLSTLYCGTIYYPIIINAMKEKVIAEQIIKEFESELKKYVFGTK